MRAGSVIRSEWASEHDRIAALITAAFASAPHSGGNEAEIVDRLRRDGDLALSLVATDAARLIGHVAFSPVAIADGTKGWFGLGPVAVMPEVQRCGIGSRLIGEGLARLKQAGAAGVVVLGDPRFYARLGFAVHAGLEYPGAPPNAFQALSFSESVPRGPVSYAAAFA